MNKRLLFFTIGIYTGIVPVHAQAPGPLPEAGTVPPAMTVIEHRALLANASREYPVTPGDVYILSYVTARGFQSFEFMVRGDYSVNLNVFGNLNAKGLTALDFARQAEERVTRSYVDSKPQCRLKSTGMFTVDVSGEVVTSARVEGWGLSTLADILGGRTTTHSSLRAVEITAAGETSAKRYDLLAALRFGARDQNPYVKPGDHVKVHKAERLVTIKGEVFRPGTYEILNGEGWRELLTLYADGVTPQGDASRVRVKRAQSDAHQEGEALTIDLSAGVPENISLLPFDEVTVPGRDERLPVVYVEGAIGPPHDTPVPKDQVSGRYARELIEGTRVSVLIRDARPRILPSADLKSAYIIRRDQPDPIPIDLETLLTSDSPQADVVLKPYDRVILPLKQQFVTVSGAVLLPGRVPYVPNRGYQYYLQQAGGTDPQKNAGSSVVITDARDQKQPLDRTIQPEDRIYAEYNNGLYYMQQWGVVITTGISLAALVVSIIQLTR